MKAWKRIVCAFFGLMTVYVSVSAEVLNGELIGVKKSVFQQSVREDFLTFEKRFVSDAEFQMSRIVFDNLGYKPDDDPERKVLSIPLTIGLSSRTLWMMCVNWDNSRQKGN